jgi:hypothetical protein
MNNKKSSNFPIWEKVYIDIKEDMSLDYFKDIKGVHVNNN